MPHIMTRLELAEYLKVSERFLKRQAELGTGPVYSKIGRLIRYNQDDVDQWIAANSRQPVRGRVAE